jgi:chemotaxis protein MotB
MNANPDNYKKWLSVVVLAAILCSPAFKCGRSLNSGAGHSKSLFPQVAQNMHKERGLSVQALTLLKKNLENSLGSDVLTRRVRLQLGPRGLVISLEAMYDSGSAQIKPEGKILLAKIVTSLPCLDNQIRVEGHTDSDEMHKWELSTARALGILKYLVEQLHFRPDLLSAVGYAGYRPAASNATEEGKNRNRRLDIIILNPVADLANSSQAAKSQT